MARIDIFLLLKEKKRYSLTPSVRIKYSSREGKKETGRYTMRSFHHFQHRTVIWVLLISQRFKFINSDRRSQVFKNVSTIIRFL